MNSTDILTISFSAFVTVFFVLSCLAIFMNIIVKLFSVKKTDTDITIYSAIASAYQTIYPGTKITKIEEVK